MKETQNGITSWARETFGDLAHTGLLVARFSEEYGEFIGAFLKNEDIRGEAADLLVFLFQIAETEGFDLLEEVDHKMAVNRGRDWKITAAGIGQHIKKGQKND